MLVLAPTDCLPLSVHLGVLEVFLTLRTLNLYLYIVLLMGRVNECNGVGQPSHSLQENLCRVDLYPEW